MPEPEHGDWGFNEMLALNDLLDNAPESRQVPGIANHVALLFPELSPKRGSKASCCTSTYCMRDEKRLVAHKFWRLLSEPRLIA